MEMAIASVYMEEGRDEREHSERREEESDPLRSSTDPEQEREGEQSEVQTGKEGEPLPQRTRKAINRGRKEIEEEEEASKFFTPPQGRNIKNIGGRIMIISSEKREEGEILSISSEEEPMEEEREKSMGKKKNSNRRVTRNMKRELSYSTSPNGVKTVVKRKKEGTPSPAVRNESPPDYRATRTRKPNVETINMDHLPAAVVGRHADGWIQEVEELRIRCKNIQGRVSGGIKQRLVRIRQAVTVLVIKAESSGDPNFLRTRNRELEGKIRKLEEENTRLREEIDKKDRKRGPNERKAAEEIVVTPDIHIYEGERGATNRRQRYREVKGTQRTQSEEEQEDPTKLMKEMEMRLSQEIESLVSKKKEAREFIKLHKQVKKQEMEIEEMISEEDKIINRKPRIIEDTWLPPERSIRIQRGGKKGKDTQEENGEKPWQIVGPNGRKERRREEEYKEIYGKEKKDEKTYEEISGRKEIGKFRRVRPPRSSAIAITAKEGTYASVLARAREKIALEELDIRNTIIRRAASENMIIEIPGEGNAIKAD